jgi:hypothetical protein
LRKSARKKENPIKNRYDCGLVAVNNRMQMIRNNQSKTAGKLQKK